MYLVGEALIGDGAELAHIDLLMGDKEGPVGSAFANSISQLSHGAHAPSCGCPPEPAHEAGTIVIPKVTLKDMSQVNEMFGPVQAAVAKAVADCVEEDAFKGLDIEGIVIMVSAFVHPDQRTTTRSTRTTTAQRSLPSTGRSTSFRTQRLSCKKDRAAHGIMGFKVTRLWDPPYLQVAMDLVDMGKVAQVLKEVPQNDHVIIEAGTPLIKKFGLGVIGEIRKLAQRVHHRGHEDPQHGNLEARMAADATADAVVVSACPDFHDREGHCGSPQGRHLLDHRYVERAEPGKALESSK